MANNEFSALLNYYLALRNEDTKDLFEKTGIKKSTFYRRLKNPELFTIAEIRAIWHCLRIPNEKIDIIIK